MLLRNLLLGALGSALLLVADDRLSVFHSCAYSPVLSPALSQPHPQFEMLVERGDASAPVADRELVGSNDRIRISVTASAAGFFYVFQDPPDPVSLLFPAVGAPSVRAAQARSETPWIRFDSAEDFTLLLVFSPEEIRGAGEMKPEDVRSYFRKRTSCWGVVFVERRIRIRRE
jgi:hypothetical protein